MCIRDRSRDLKSLPLDLLKEKMTELSEKPFRAKQLYDWMHVKLAGDYDEMKMCIRDSHLSGKIHPGKCGTEGRTGRNH